MCANDKEGAGAPPQGEHHQENHQEDHQEPFPTDTPLYDAHCHPTDTMSSIERIPDMKARALTIMATRSQDQGLVQSVLYSKGIRSQADLEEKAGDRKVIGAFGWHPWFSHQLIDDVHWSNAPPNNDTNRALLDYKLNHYNKVLVPAPPDEKFVQQLPSPMSLSQFIKETKRRLEAHPLAMVGEIGLDKAFRLPEAWKDGEELERDDTLTPGGREGRRLSPYHVSLDHQRLVLKLQLALAGEMMRPVSVHGVGCHGVLYNVIENTWLGYEKDVVSSRDRKRVAPNAEDWSSDSSEDEEEGEGEPKGPKQEATKKELKPMPFPPRICLHSYSGSVEVAKRYLKRHVPTRIFFSFSCAVNLSTESASSRLEDVLRVLPKDRILVESDLHVAGEDMDRSLEEIAKVICRVKGWELSEGVKRLERNYKEFVFG